MVALVPFSCVDASHFFRVFADIVSTLERVLARLAAVKRCVNLEPNEETLASIEVSRVGHNGSDKREGSRAEEIPDTVETR